MRAWPYLALFAGALLLRVVYLFEWHDTVLFSVLLGDGRQYDSWARQIAAGEWFGAEVFYQAPLYPYFMAVVYSVFGRDLWALRVVQVVAGSASCVMLALAGTRFFDRRTGLLAGALAAVYGPAIYFDALVQKGVLGGLLMAALLFTLGEFLASRRTSWMLTAGLVLGFFALARENALILPPIVAAWLWLGYRDERPRRRAAWIAVFLVGIALVLVPVGLRNRAVGGRFLVTTSQAGPNFYIGNNPEANGRYRPLREGRGDARYERRDAAELARSAVGHELGPREVSRYWFGRSLSYVRERPGSWLALMARKGFLVWHAGEIMDTDSIESYMDASVLLRTLGRCAHFGLLLPLALAGICVTRRQWRRLWLLYAIITAMALAVAAFYVLARYRYPIVPPLMLFASAGILEVIGKVRERRWSALALPALLLAVATVAVNWPLRADLDPRTITHYSLGSALLEAERLDDARVQLERALELDPQFASARFQMGDALTRMGRAEEALEHLREAVRLDPEYADAHTGLGTALMQLGRLEEALLHYRAAVRLDPAGSAAHNNLAILLVRQQRFSEAVQHWETALEITPDDVEVHLNLGKVLLVGGDAERARSHFERALELEPSNADARQWLSRASRPGP